MLINVILIIFSIVGFGILLFFLVCLYKQYRSSSDSNCVELFPKEDIYVENAYEGEKFNMSTVDKKESERWAATQRGSVRIACGVYFTSDEYTQYREGVLKKDLP